MHFMEINTKLFVYLLYFKCNNVGIHPQRRHTNAWKSFCFALEWNCCWCYNWPGVAGTPRMSWQCCANTSVVSARGLVCRDWSTLQRTTWRRFISPEGDNQVNTSIKTVDFCINVRVVLFCENSSVWPVLATLDAISLSSRVSGIGVPSL